MGIEDCGASREAAAYVDARYSRPPWAKGSIGRADAAFLFDLIMRERPRALAEIGVASGVSTVFLATLLADRLRESRLYSVDKLSVFYDDPSRPVGAYIGETFGEAPSNLTLGAGVTSTDIRLWPSRPERFDFVFLDANHMHPWPCLDLLSILDLIEPGAWIALHDIRLPLRQANSQAFGPLYLFESWPGERRSAAHGDADIGAIRLYEQPSRNAAALIECCRIPWQSHIPFSEWRSALDALSHTNFEVREELRAVVAQPPLARTSNRAFWEITIRGPNPWSRIPHDLGSAPLILHANRRGEPAISVSVRRLRRSECSGIVFPGFKRSPDAPGPLQVELSLVANGARISHRVITLDGPEANFAFLRAPEETSGTFDLDIGVSLIDQAEKISGAWVKFEPLQFV
ncbi:class I SAM-dependent methyltransferase [Mesorhizobium comanense]|uniref:class I SAM-dependent methyltransferase n=1 Tax=Mesorhizobium comanense TaxID=2502215 RepID=UPI0014852A59|nr:class I SAM-dependent methyltransferase [Mesorhizobium comanense]